MRKNRINIRSTLFNVSINIMFGLLVMGLVLIYSQFSKFTETFNIWIVVVGILFTLPIIIGLVMEGRKYKKEDEIRLKELVRFKKGAIKVRVSLENAKIKSNSWSEDQIVNKSKYAGINNLIGEGQRNVKSVTQNSSIVTLKIPYKNSLIKYEFSTGMAEITLRMKFALEKETTLYIDPNNKRNKYLDLDFLNE